MLPAFRSYQIDWYMTLFTTLSWQKVVIRTMQQLSQETAFFEKARPTYLFPEGTASVIGLTAMMCDYYSMLLAMPLLCNLLWRFSSMNVLRVALRICSGGY